MEFIVNYSRLALVLFILGYTASSFAMTPHESLNPEIAQKIHENPFIEKEIVKMIITAKNPPAWLSWLIGRNILIPTELHRLLSAHNIVTQDSNIDVKFPCSLEHKVFSDPHCFRNYKATHPHKCAVNEDGSIIVTRFDDLSFTIENPGSNTFIDTAFSRDGQRFIAITPHKILIWDGNNGRFIDKIKLNGYELEEIIDIKAKSYAVILKNQYEIFSYDPLEKNVHLIYKYLNDRPFDYQIPEIRDGNFSHDDRSCTPVSALHCIASEGHYTFARRYYGDSCSDFVKVFSFTDIYEQLFTLNIDQIELLKLIYYTAKHQNMINKKSLESYIKEYRRAEAEDIPCAVNFPVKHHHMVDLTGNSPETIRAREAYNKFPPRIKRLIQQFVIMPGRLENCTIC